MMSWRFIRNGHIRSARRSASTGSRFARLAAVLLLLAVTACASGADPGAMAVRLSEATMLPDHSSLRQAISVGTVGGGRETSPLGASEVSDSAFAEALRRSLAVHALLATGEGRWRLEATILRTDAPIMGFDMTVSVQVRYKLLGPAGQVAFDQEIPSTFTADFSSAIQGVQRLRLAKEGAIRTNIGAFLTALATAARDEPSRFSPAMAGLLGRIPAQRGA